MNYKNLRNLQYATMRLWVSMLQIKKNKSKTFSTTKNRLIDKITILSTHNCSGRNGCLQFHWSTLHTSGLVWVAQAQNCAEAEIRSKLSKRAKPGTVKNKNQ